MGPEQFGIGVSPGSTGCSVAGIVSASTYTPVANTSMDMSRTMGGASSFVIEETGGANGITATADGSNDGTNWASTIVTPVTVAASATGFLQIAAGYRYVRLSIKDTSSGNHGTISAQGFGK